MVPPMLHFSNFKFKYFFGAQILIENFIPPIANPVSCNVLESNNSGKQINFPHALELHFSSPKIFVVSLDAMLEIFVIMLMMNVFLFLKNPKKLLVMLTANFNRFGL
jgi:hypothetical protein